MIHFYRIIRFRAVRTVKPMDNKNSYSSIFIMAKKTNHLPFNIDIELPAGMNLMEREDAQTLLASTIKNIVEMVKRKVSAIRCTIESSIDMISEVGRDNDGNPIFQVTLKNIRVWFLIKIQQKFLEILSERPSMINSIKIVQGSPSTQARKSHVVKDIGFSTVSTFGGKVPIPAMNPAN